MILEEGNHIGKREAQRSTGVDSGNIISKKVVISLAGRVVRSFLRASRQVQEMTMVIF